MKYSIEKDFILTNMIEAYGKFSATPVKNIVQKTEFDLVTELDCNIEEFLVEKINEKFPEDKILGEETSSSQEIVGRTWTIDPIDGTCNFAHGMGIFGVQCALFEDGDVVMSALYIPKSNEVYYAIKGEGAYLNDKKILSNKDATAQNAIASFGDYTHGNKDLALFQHRLIANVYPKIAKIRMFGSACVDFSYVASAKTDVTVVITKNLWDIAPGILLCREAGCILKNIRGEDYSFGDDGVIAICNSEIANVFVESIAECI